MSSRRNRPQNKKSNPFIIVLIVILVLGLLSLTGILLFYLNVIRDRVFETPEIEPPIVSNEVYNHYNRIITYSNIKNNTKLDFMEALALDLMRKNGTIDNKLDSILEVYDKFTKDEDMTISFSNIEKQVSDFNNQNSSEIDWKDIVSALTIENKYIQDLKNSDNSKIYSLCKDFVDANGNTLDLDQYLKNNNKTINYVNINFRDKEKINNSITVKSKNIKTLDDITNELSLSEDDKNKLNTNLQKIKELTYPSDVHLDFISQIYADAKSNQYDFKIFTSITIAQAILESNWGTSKLYTEGKNIFGIKAFGDWTGETIKMSTTEHDTDSGKDIIIDDYFRKYDDYDGSIIDHSLFLNSNSRYTDSGVFNAQSYKEQAKAIKSGGYATDPNYDTNLIQLIEENELFLFDD